MIAKIDHREPRLAQHVIVLDTSGGRQQLRVEFLTNGEESVNSVGAGQMRTRASWKNEELLIESWLTAGERMSHFRDFWTLSTSGDTLTMEHRDDDLAGQVAVLERAPDAQAEFQPES